MMPRPLAQNALLWLKHNALLYYYMNRCYAGGVTLLLSLTHPVVGMGSPQPDPHSSYSQAELGQPHKAEGFPPVPQGSNSHFYSQEYLWPLAVLVCPAF